MIEWKSFFVFMFSKRKMNICLEIIISIIYSKEIKVLNMIIKLYCQREDLNS